MPDAWTIHTEHFVRNPVGVSNYRYINYYGWLLAVIDQFERTFFS